MQADTWMLLRVIGDCGHELLRRHILSDTMLLQQKHMHAMGRGRVGVSAGRGLEASPSGLEFYGGSGVMMVLPDQGPIGPETAIQAPVWGPQTDPTNIEQQLR